jgi:hypothetical protein
MTPYRTNAFAWSRPRFRFALSRRTRIAVAGAMVVMLVPAAIVAGRGYVSKRNEVAAQNSRLEAERFQKKAVAWRSAHPLSCPTLVDIGESPMSADAWNAGYAIECTATMTIVRSEHVQYPEQTYEDDPGFPR